MQKSILAILIFTVISGCKTTDSSLKTLDNFTRMDGETLRLYACEGDQKEFGTERFMGREVFKINDAITNHRDTINKSFNLAMTSIPESLQETYFTLEGSIEVVPNGWCSQNMGDSLHKSEKKYFSERDVNASGSLKVRTCSKQSFGNNMMANSHTQYIEVGDLSGGARADLLPELRHNVVRAFGYILATRLSHVYMTDGNLMKYIGNRQAPGFMEARIELVAALLTDLSWVAEEAKETGEASRYSYDVTVTSYMPCDKEGDELICHNETDKNTKVHRMLSDMFNISGSQESRIPLRKNKIREIVDTCSDSSFASSQCLTFMRFLDYIMAESFDSFYCTINNRNSVNDLPSSRKVMKEDFPLTYKRYKALDDHLSDDGQEGQIGMNLNQPGWLVALEIVGGAALLVIPVVGEIADAAIVATIVGEGAVEAAEVGGILAEAAEVAEAAEAGAGNAVPAWMDDAIAEGLTEDGEITVTRQGEEFTVKMKDGWSKGTPGNRAQNLAEHWEKHGIQGKEFEDLGITTKEEYQTVAFRISEEGNAMEYSAPGKYNGSIYYDVESEVCCHMTNQGAQSVPKTMYRVNPKPPFTAEGTMSNKAGSLGWKRIGN